MNERQGASGIGAYGFISDCHSAALVTSAGSIDWWCVPRFDSASVLGRLLDPDAGHWSLCPSAAFTTSRSYLDETLVLRTVFETGEGEVEVLDLMSLESGARGHDIGRHSPHVLCRQITGLRGTVLMNSEFAPRMEYGRTVPYLTSIRDGVQARGGPASLTLRGVGEWTITSGVARTTFEVRAGDTVELRLEYAPAFPSDPESTPPGTVADTVAAWESWSALHTGYDGEYRDAVRRSSLVLQGLTYQPSGAVLAAATTSLPELMGSELNFDYRYAWLRDLSLTARALWVAACPDEPQRLLEWVANAAGALGDERVQIMYGAAGERDITEHELDHLAGFGGSRPVRVGNAAWDQSQLDVLGEVLDAAHLLRDSLGDASPQVRELLIALAHRAATTWEEPDAGMWEARDKGRQYVSSKVMCWVALDRAVKLAGDLGPASEPDKWAEVRDQIHTAVLEQAWSEPAGAYTGAFGSDELDASVLLLPLVGFLPATDPRMRATIDAIVGKLGGGGLIRRWADDRSGFLICSYWLVECYALAGEIDLAREWFDKATAHANDLGLLAEEADPRSGELLGNFPQAFSHVGLINAAWRISEAASNPTPPPGGHA